MRLTPFGRTARTLRMDFDCALKEMAEAMQISSAYLSSIEHGEKRLTDVHINLAIDFFTQKGATKLQLTALRDDGERSKDVLSTGHLPNDAKTLVAAFARRLQEGRQPSDEMLNFLQSRM
jgi:transcriptional regulator with XRE-family HTH domain